MLYYNALIVRDETHFNLLKEREWGKLKVVF